MPEDCLSKETPVFVRRQPNGHDGAEVRLGDLVDPHWSSISGGVGVPSPYLMLCAYIRCDAIVDGEIAHSCRHGAGPHQIKVVVIKKYNDKNVYAELCRRARPKPPPVRTTHA
jgi:hypothetical protein